MIRGKETSLFMVGEGIGVSRERGRVIPGCRADLLRRFLSNPRRGEEGSEREKPLREKAVYGKTVL